MKRVAIFGNAGGGKSTLARTLSEITRLPLHVIDKMQFREGGDPVPQDVFHAAHAKLLAEDEWIIDGFGSAGLAWERFARADTLIYVDLPLRTHYWRVTKRFIGGLFVTPAGWPKGSPLWSSTRQSYKVIPLCERHLAPKYRNLVADEISSKRVHHLRSPREVAAFVESVRREYARN